MSLQANILCFLGFERQKIAYIHKMAQNIRTFPAKLVQVSYFLLYGSKLHDFNLTS